MTSPVHGVMNAEKAIRILLKGTGLRTSSRDGKTFVLATGSGRTAGSATRNPDGVGNNLGTTVTPSHAAEDGPTAIAGPSSGDGDIVVTGSRVGRSENTNSVPVSVVSADAIAKTGATNIQDVLRNLPSVGQGIGRSNTNFANSGNGVATVNLRNLGSARTLVLANGRRFVAGVPGSSAVDLNAIPTDFIERIEVITGGASAAYGSEAIAGVVNFILKDHFDGLKMHAQTSISSAGDAPHQYVSATAGQSFAEDRGQIILNGSYDNDRGLRSRNRSYSAVDSPNRSSFNAQGLFSPSGDFARGASTFTFDQNNVLKQYQGANVDGYNRNGDRYLSIPVERFNAAGLASFKISDGLSSYGEFEYSRTKTVAGVEPLGIASAPSLAHLNYQDGTPYNGVPITNVYIPAAIRAAMIQQGVTVLPFRRRLNDVFNRNNRNDRESWRIVAGAKGSVTSNLSYDMYYNHGETTEHTSRATVLAPNFRNALDSVQTASGPSCRINADADPTNNDAACAPIDIFGFNTVSAAAANYVTNNGQRQTYDARVTQDNVVGSITGSILSLPAGQVKFAVGGEYRREHSAEVYDQATNQGLTLGGQFFDTKGGFDVKESFGEIVVPLFANQRFAKYLGLEGAVRYADYSTVGGIVSYKIGGDYAPTSDIRFRAVYAQATRAPNIGELYAPKTDGNPAIVDPCDQGGGRGDGASLSPLSAACRAIPSVAATAARTGQFAYSTAQLQTILGFVGGNQDLHEETARTLTAGVVLSPSFIRGLSITADYYRISVKNAIGIIGQQISVNQCVATGDPLYCNNVIRSSSGNITRVNATNMNVGSYLVSGIDVQGAYRFKLGFADVQTTVFWNHLLRQEQTPYPGGPDQKEVGQLSCSGCGRLGTGFKDRVAASANVSVERASLNWRSNYQSAVVDSLTSSSPIRVKPYWYHNMQMSVMAGSAKRLELQFGINNIFNKLPPILGDTNIAAYPGTATAADSYDLVGRVLYAGVNIAF